MVLFPTVSPATKKNNPPTYPSTPQKNYDI